MSAFQKEVLKWLGGKPRYLEHRWLWPQDIRRDKKLAERVYWLLNL